MKSEETIIAEAVEKMQRAYGAVYGDYLTAKEEEELAEKISRKREEEPKEPREVQ